MYIAAWLVKCVCTLCKELQNHNVIHVLLHTCHCTCSRRHANTAVHFHSIRVITSRHHVAERGGVRDAEFHPDEVRVPRA